MIDFMARTIKDAHTDIGGVDALGFGETPYVFVGWRIKINDAFGVSRANRQLIHVGIRRMQETAARREGDHCERIGHGFRGERRALERIECDVDLYALPRADFFADIEHRRFIALAFADDDAALHGHGVERGAHGVDCGLVGGLLVTATYELGGGLRGGDGHACSGKSKIVGDGSLTSSPHSKIRLRVGVPQLS